MCARVLVAALLSVLGCRAQDLANLQIEKLASGFQFTTGPVWSRDGYLVFSDIPSNRILELAPPASDRDKAKAAVFRNDSNGATGNSFDVQGRLYTCEAHARRVTRTDKKGKVEVLASEWEGKRLNAPNDIVVRHDGQIYFTDPAFGSAVDRRELNFYGVFHLTPKGEISAVAKWQTRPNGVALSPDGKTLYVSDSDLHAVHAFDLDRAGAATNDRVLLKGIRGVPEGLRTDENGNLYVAANAVAIYEPNGKLIGEVPMADPPSSCAFGDDGFESLYITSHAAVYRARLGVKGSVQY